MTLYDDVFSALDAAAVRYVVVGGVAVVLRGHARLTVDLDLVIDLAVAPATAAIDALLSLGLLPRIPVNAHDFANPEVRSGWVEQRNLQVLSFYDPADLLREVDVFAAYPLPWEELVRDAETVRVGGLAVPVASIPHLIRMKQAAGRPQDLSDVAALRELLGGKQEGHSSDL